MNLGIITFQLKLNSMNEKPENIGTSSCSASDCYTLGRSTSDTSTTFLINLENKELIDTFVFDDRIELVYKITPKIPIWGGKEYPEIIKEIIKYEKIGDIIFPVPKYFHIS